MHLKITAPMIALTATVMVMGGSIGSPVLAQTAGHPQTGQGTGTGAESHTDRPLSAREAPLVRDIAAEDAREGANRIGGAKLYSRYCVACHGKTGDGKGPKLAQLSTPPPDFTSPSAITSMSRKSMLRTINGGHKGNVAQFWMDKVSAHQSQQLVAFIQDAFMLPAATADAGVGRQIFARTCSVCHGERGDSASWAKNSLKPSPFDFTSYKAKRLSRRHMLNTVTYGSQGTAMMGFATQLSRAEIAAVVDYIRRAFIFPEQTLKSQNQETQVASAPKSGKDHHGSEAAPKGKADGGHHGSEAAPKGKADGHDHNQGQKADMSLPFADNLTGDLARGKKLFEQNCAPCHGKTGKGDGSRAYFIFPRPENFVSKRAKAELNRPHLFSSISNGVMGTVMPSWDKVFDSQQVADVAEYLFTRFIYPDGATPQAEAAKKK